MLIDRLFVIVAVVCDKDYMLCEVKLTLDVIIPELVEKLKTGFTLLLYISRFAYTLYKLLIYFVTKIVTNILF